LYKPRAIPRASNPGPRLAVDAGTRSRTILRSLTTLSLCSACIHHAGPHPLGLPISDCGFRIGHIRNSTFEIEGAPSQPCPTGSRQAPLPVAACPVYPMPAASCKSSPAPQKLDFQGSRGL
jgi:hypothetical protein